MPALDAEMLARLQFAFTISFHILFPTITIGLAGFLLILEARWLRTGDEIFLRLYHFWIRLFALTFGMGVVSGIVLSYQFGTNWSEFSRISGPVLGPLIGFEVLTAFFMEAGFLGVMLFGWDKVGPRLHFLATCLVAFGTTLSAFWILSANSWMQTPAGAHIDPVLGSFVADDWFAIIFNPSFPYRLAHMLTAAYLTTSIFVAGISSFYLLGGRHTELARKSQSIALWAVLILAPLQIFIGDQHGLNVLEYQPTKVAAMEGNWDRQAGAPLLLFAIPDSKKEKNHLELAIPHGASLILTHKWDGVVPGLRDVPKADRPPVGVVFWSFRVMVGLGVLFLLIGAWGLYARIKDRLESDRWFNRLCVAATPLGLVATLAGWFVAEVGRQPYTIYGVLRTADSASPIVSATMIASTLAVFLVVYGGLFGAYLYYLGKLIRVGPSMPATEREEHPEAVQGARPGLVVPHDE
jgi:cytochrome d ubiquinol oxidase subunit I